MVFRKIAFNFISNDMTFDDANISPILLEKVLPPTSDKTSLMENCIFIFPIFAIFPKNGFMFRTKHTSQRCFVLPHKGRISGLSLKSVATVVGCDVSQMANLRGFILSHHDVNESLEFLAQVEEFAYGHSRSIKKTQSVLASSQTEAANRRKG